MGNDFVAEVAARRRRDPGAQGLLGLSAVLAVLSVWLFKASWRQLGGFHAWRAGYGEDSWAVGAGTAGVAAGVLCVAVLVLGRGARGWMGLPPLPRSRLWNLLHAAALLGGLATLSSLWVIPCTCIESYHYRRDMDAGLVVGLLFCAPALLEVPALIRRGRAAAQARRGLLLSRWQRLEDLPRTRGPLRVRTAGTVVSAGPSLSVTSQVVSSARIGVDGELLVEAVPFYLERDGTRALVDPGDGPVRAELCVDPPGLASDPGDDVGPSQLRVGDSVEVVGTVAGCEEDGGGAYRKGPPRVSGGGRHLWLLTDGEGSSRRLRRSAALDLGSAAVLVGTTLAFVACWLGLEHWARLAVQHLQ